MRPLSYIKNTNPRYLILIIILAGLILFVNNFLINNSLSGLRAKVRQSPKVQKFIEENENIYSLYGKYNSTSLQKNKGIVPDSCLPRFNFDQDYYKVTFHADSEELEAWLRADNREVICTVKESKEGKNKS